MASVAAVEAMAKHLPPEFTDLETVVRKGQQYAVNVMGIVDDFMPPTQTKGSDMQLTFTLRDKSMLPNGLRIKFFRKSPEDFPQIQAHGDVVLLRNIRITTFSNQLMAISTWQSEFVVFHMASLVSITSRRSISRPGALVHTKSSSAPVPNVHEQQWALTLHRDLNAPQNFQSPPVHSHSSPSTTQTSITGPAQSCDASTETSGSVPIRHSSAREKFSLLKNIKAGSKGDRSSGNFYDLAGEVVKMFFSNLGSMDMYICDYTVNSLLPDHQLDGSESNDGRSWQGPSGRMTLHIELWPPHSVWANNNIKEGDFVFLKNVRVKWNQKGLGNELEGNMWEDKFYRDRVHVSRLAESHPQYSEIKTRKSSYIVNVLGKTNGGGGSKTSKRRKAKANKKAKKQKLASCDSQNGDTPDQSSDPGEESGLEQEVKRVQGPDTEIHSTDDNHLAFSTRKLNPNVKCVYDDMPLSTFHDIVHNPHRWTKTSTGVDYEFPFINVKHHARLRVVDFFPHDLKDFSVYCSAPSDPSKFYWAWRFWLVVASADSNESEKSLLNVGVFAEDADDLLRILACDLSRNTNRLKDLGNTLFLLWGELAEKKDKFLRSHPNIHADADFSASKYNIKAENRAFDACIAEYGVRMPPSSSATREAPEQDGTRVGEDGFGAWERAYKLFGTRITT